MRFKKQKRHRKVVRFYTTCFGFREPFKVLCDGTFIHHLLSNHLQPHISLSNTLAAPVHLFTSKCVIEELKSLGSSHAQSFLSARKDYKLARCEHEKKSGLDCIIEIIGQNNPEHFFVATQDMDLRKIFRKVPGVPVIFGLRNALFLEQLSSFQREFVKSAEEERSHMTDVEYRMLQKRVKNILNADEIKDSSTVENEDENEPVGDKVFPDKKAERKRIEMKDKAQFKRKRAKGPNPLSCKKKKNPGNSGYKPKRDDKAGGNDNAPRNRPRKRKRTRKAKTSAGTDVASS